MGFVWQVVSEPNQKTQTLRQKRPSKIPSQKPLPNPKPHHQQNIKISTSRCWKSGRRAQTQGIFLIMQKKTEPKSQKKQRPERPELLPRAISCSVWSWHFSRESQDDVNRNSCVIDALRFITFISCIYIVYMCLHVLYVFIYLLVYIATSCYIGVSSCRHPKPFYCGPRIQKSSFFFAMLEGRKPSPTFSI